MKITDIKINQQLRSLINNWQDGCKCKSCQQFRLSIKKLIKRIKRIEDLKEKQI